jgi:gentisate 1,2-dioxygenase
MATRAAGKLDLSAGQQSLAAMMAQAGVVNGWHKDEPSLWPSPKRHFVPAHWSYAQACTILDAAGAVVSIELAERRNVILANPIPGNRYATVRTLVSAYQMVKPGETARSHRHSANALRLVLDAAPGMYTIVEGRRIPMMPGDVLLTPNWHWHGHCNESNANGYWLDFLDVPLVHLLGPMFFEHHPAGIERDAPLYAGSPMRFPWETICRRLADAPVLVPGRREIALETPALATIGLKVMRMACRSSFRHGPTTASAIYAAIEGEGACDVDERGFVWARGDVIAVPSGATMICRTSADSTLLRVDDEPLFERAGWLRSVPVRD